MLPVLALLALNQGSTLAEMDRWKAEAARVTIVRDDWGIAHVHGHSDADAVFGMIYAQAEDDFSRIEANYLTSLGRQAEAGDTGRLWIDVRWRLFNDPDEMEREYSHCPKWLRKLMDAWADGLNFYLTTHPETHPRLLKRFEPWMTLAFSEGSIGGDPERIDPRGLEAFYGPNSVDVPANLVRSSALGGRVAEAGTSRAEAFAYQNEEGSQNPDSGSNGIAIAASNTRDHHALLLINPHTSFFFRSVLQVSSDEGLNAYGAVTWGQFFIYQGFNERCGWMHTSSQVDAVDWFAETVSQTPAGWVYKYGNQKRLLQTRPIRVGTGQGSVKMISALYTCHGPVVRTQGGKWISIAIMRRPVEALEQSFLRTKARGYADYRKTMDLRANSSNNTVFADADGDIAYFNGNFIPRRDARFDYSGIIDGSDPATDWHGLFTVDQTPHLLNPASGFIFNVNDSPWQGAGKSSLRKQDFPRYFDKGSPQPRSVHCLELLDGKTGFTLDSLQAAAFDRHLPWFEKPIPALLQAWDRSPQSMNLSGGLREPIEVLRKWDLGWGAHSVATSLAIYWGEELRRSLGADARQAGLTVEEYAGSKAPGEQLVECLHTACARLTRDFGTWKTPWGEINRFQRLDDRIESHFDDAKPSIPVPFTASDWGSLAAFGARPYPNTKKWYGTSGNSFVAVVEFGPRVRAKAITAGGESGSPGSKHFDDQARLYASGNLQDVYFYPDQLVGHTERTYHPGAPRAR